MTRGRQLTVEICFKFRCWDIFRDVSTFVWYAGLSGLCTLLYSASELRIPEICTDASPIMYSTFPDYVQIIRAVFMLRIGH